MQCMMDHIVLNMEDDDAMIDFYSKVLLLETERLEEYRSRKVPFPSVRLNADTVIDLFPKRLWQKDAATEPCRAHLNHFCFSMDKKSWDELIDRLKNCNISIVEGPVLRWGAHGTGTSIYFRDPEENLIEARYYQGNDDSEKCMLDS